MELKYIISAKDDGSLARVLKKANQQAAGLGDSISDSVRKSEGSLTRLEKVVAGAFTANAIKSFVSELVHVRGEFQQIENALETMTGSQDKANALMSEWKDLTLRSPFRLSELATSGKQLLAYGIDIKNVTRDIEMLANVAAGTSQPISDLAYVYGTLKTQGRAFTQDIRQFTGRGINLIPELSKQFKVAEEDVMGLVEAGKVGFPEVEKALQSLTGVGGQFNNLIGKQAETLTGQINRLKHEVELAFNEMGENSEGFLSEAIGSTAVLVEHYKEIGKVLTVIATTYGSFKAATAIIIALEAATLAQTKAVNAEAIATSAATQAALTKLRADTESAAASKARAVQEATSAQASLVASRARLSAIQSESAALTVLRAQNELSAATEKASIARKAALSASSDFYTKKIQLETGAASASLQKEVSSLAVKKQRLTQNAALAQSEVLAARARLTAIQTTGAAETKNAAVRNAQHAVDSAADRASVARKAALAASSDFYSKKIALETVAKNTSTVAETRLSSAQALRAAVSTRLIAIQNALNASMLANPYVLVTVAVTATVAAIWALHDGTSAQEKATKQLADENKKLKDRTDELASATSRLTSILNDSTETRFAQLRAFAELQALYPDMLRNMSIEEFQALSTADAQRALNKARDERQVSDKSDQLDREIEKLAKLQKGYDEIAKSGGQGAAAGLSIVQRQIDVATEKIRLLKKGIEEFAETQWEANASPEELIKHYESAIGKLKKQREEAEKFLGSTNRVGEAWRLLDFSPQIQGLILINKQIGETEAKIKGLKGEETVGTQNKSYWEKQKKLAEDALEGMTPSEKGNAAWNKQLKNLEEAKKRLKTWDFSNKESAKVENKLARDKRKLLEDIEKAEQESFRNGMVRRDAEIQAEKDKYAQLRKEALRVGAPVSNLTKIVDLENVAIRRVEYGQETDILTKQLENQRQTWEDYYAMLDATSEESAKTRYKVELGYEAKLQNDIAPLMTKKLDGKITMVEEDRLRKLVEIQTEFAKMQEQRQLQVYQRAYQAALTHTQKIEQIEREYRENVAALGEGASKEQLAQLQRDRDERVSAETSANLKIEENWDEMFNVMAGLSRKSAKEWLKNAERRLDYERRTGKLTVKEYQDLSKEINQAINDIDHRDPFSGLFSKIGDYKKNVKEFGRDSDKAKQSFRDMTGIASEAFNGVAEVVGTVADSFEQLGIGGEGLQEALGKVQDLAGGLSELSEGIATKNPVAIITGSIKTLTSVISLFNTKDKKLQKQIEGYERALKSLQTTYSQLQKGIENSVGTSYYEDSAKAVTNLEEQIKNMEAARDAESRKKKKDQGAIDSYNQGIEDAKNQIDELHRAISEQLLQTNYKALSDNLANALLSAFEAGENGIDALNGSFDQFIKNALANSLKLKLIEPLIKEMTDELTKYMLGNDGSLVGFDFAKWRDQLKEAGEQFEEGLESAFDELDLEKDKDKDKPGDGLSGTIGRAITEDTANKWMGIQLNMYTITKNHFAEAQAHTKLMHSHINLAQQNLNAALGIERNTAGTWEEMKNAVGYLVTIANNTKQGKTSRDLG